jgi:VWFA-related protein
MARGRRGGGCSYLLTVLSVIFLFFFFAFGAAQAPLQHEVTVTLKLIQVFVTGPDGKPARGLAKSDFALTDNGKPQAITDFESHVLAVPATERAVAVAAPSPVPIPAGEAPLLSRKFIFLIDYIRNVFEGVQKAKAAALDFLETKVGPDDEVGLFTLSPMSGLTLHEYLTTDHAKVRAKIKKLHDSIGGGGGASVSSDELMGMELLNAQVMAGHGGHAGPSSRNIFADIAEWAKALRAIPGQKNIILFTMGFGNGVVRPGRLNNVLFETMARALASANAPVFTVDTSPQALPGRDIEDTLPSGTLAERSLDYLSKTTGGMYLGGVNYSSRIAAEIHDATANYYVLGYGVPAAWDGKYHEVKVEVRKPGYTVHAQRGYYNPVPFAELSPIEKHIHLIEIALGEGSTAKATRTFPMIAVPFAGVEGANTLLLSEIPADVADSVGDRVELISLVLGPTSAIVDGKRVELVRSDFGGGVYEYSTVSLAPGRYECRSVIRDLDDGRAAVGACAIDVAAPPAGGPAIFPPLLLVRGAEGRYLNMASPGQASGAAGPSIAAIFPFPVKDYVPLVGALGPGRTELCAMLRCLWGGERRAQGERELAARIAPEGTEDWEPVEMTLVTSSSRDAVDFYLLKFELPVLAPGRYRLEITAEDPDSGSVLRTSSVLSVR